MFLSVTKRRNPALLNAARELHRAGVIGPDTYVIDEDAVGRNAAAVADTAAQYDIKPWFVMKQLGRVPALTRKVAMHIPEATAIDVREARAVSRGGARLGNVGHLVQVPRRVLPHVLAAQPAYITVFDEANLRAVADAAADTGRTQRVLLRISGSESDTYPGQEGGSSPARVNEMADLAAALGSVRVEGVTGFPCFLFDRKTGKVRPTATAERVLEAAETLRNAGCSPVIDLPSQSSCSTIPLVAALGGTHVEPGHALTGTTPEHACSDDLIERPAIVYVSEVAQESPEPSVFGGGFYPRGHARNVLLGDGDDIRHAELVDSPPENIDYYRRLRGIDGNVRPHLGEVALMAFRTQLFVLRSRIAVVSGAESGTPTLVGLFDSHGREVEPGDL